MVHRYSPVIPAFLLVLVIPSLLLAGTGPSESESSLSVAIDVHPTSPWGGNPVFWCPSGDGDRVAVTVQVNDASSDPCEDCVVELQLNVDHDPQDELGAVPAAMICGTSPRSLTTDATGQVTFYITGGGCGRFNFNLFATVTCPGFGSITLGPVLEQYCMRTPDFNGSLTVNFFDTFKFLPQLFSATGFCGNFNPSGGLSVNFFDTFVYLPHLAGTHQCSPGLQTGAEILGDCP